MTYLEGRLDTLRRRRRQMIKYLKLKVVSQDWHAVWDAACEIGGLEETIRDLETVWMKLAQESLNKSTVSSTKETTLPASPSTQTGAITALAVLPPGSVQT